MSVTAANGFVASGVHAGLRRTAPDLAIVRTLTPATGAAMFTANRMQAAPVVISKEHLELAEPQAVVINSGSANAATGLRGELDARATAAEAARLLGLAVEEIVVLSTGVIGKRLALDKILPALRTATDSLSGSGGANAAEAILTTDTHAKQAVANGPGEAKDFLRTAVDESFNAISVDGECSTNDTVVLLANGESGAKRSAASDTAFDECLRAVCADLAGQIVTDGEGATFTATISVSGAASDLEAKAIARRIATSPLVKTALFGRDANWGRVLAAAGSAPYNGGYAQLDPDCVTLDLAGVRVVDAGAPQEVEPTLDGAGCTIVLDLALGEGSASYLTRDLSYDYVRINAEYRS